MCPKVGLTRNGNSNLCGAVLLTCSMEEPLSRPTRTSRNKNKIPIRSRRPPSQYDPSRQQVVDFNILEVMACSTTRTGDVLRSLHDVLEGSQIQRTLKYGINYRQVISRMMVQILAKAFACEKWNKRMIWAVQDVFYRYMQATTNRSIPYRAGNPASSRTPDRNTFYESFERKDQRPGHLPSSNLSQTHGESVSYWKQGAELRPKQVKSVAANALEFAPLSYV